MNIKDFRQELNFRDAGGYETTDGRHIREGLFYRCGQLGDLTVEELNVVKSLGIRHVFDFRATGEAAKKPDPDIGAEYHLVPGLKIDGTEIDFSPDSIKLMAEKAQGEDLTGSVFVKIMYHEIIEDNDAFQQVFNALKRGETPVLFHCTAGKDRTGMMAAFIQLALGASTQTALGDYMKTNTCRHALIQKGLEEEPDKDPEEITGRYGVTQSAFQESLHFITDKWGSLENYFQDQYGLDESTLKHMKDMYLAHD